MKKNKKILISAMIVLIAVAAFVGIRLNQPAYTLTMDVNPSIEIVSNRLDKVVEVKPLNEDAKEMLKDFKIKDRNLKDTIEDLADLMVLKGYISGGKDNLVMITVNDNVINQESVDKLNNYIVAYLENKQIEATVLNQSIDKEHDDRKTGKELVAEKLSKLDDDLDYNKLSNMTLKELVSFAEERNISPEKLFSKIIGTKSVKENNELIEDKKNDDNKDDNDYDKDDNKKERQRIGDEKAKEIALGLVNGEIINFDYDDEEYEIVISKDNYHYEIEIDAYTGKVTEFEKDDIDYDYNDDKYDKDDDKDEDWDDDQDDDMDDWYDDNDRDDYYDDKDDDDDDDDDDRDDDDDNDDDRDDGDDDNDDDDRDED